MQPAGESGRPTFVISGSLAFDYIMTYPGSFQDHIIPDKTHVLSVSFLFDSLRRYRGGVAGNIAYNFALLGERPMLVGAGGSDFGDYRAVFAALGIDTSRVVDVPAELTGSAFMSADLAGNQIAGFYPGRRSLPPSSPCSTWGATRFSEWSAPRLGRRCSATLESSPSPDVG